MRSNNMNDISEEAKRELFSRFMEFSGQTIACAYWYAKALSDYGINIAARWETITQQKAALDSAYVQGRNDEAKRFNNADVRPVVLCRDCVHYEMGVCLKIYDDGSANKDAWQERKPDDYCSYGEDRNVPTKESEEVSAVRCWLTNGADMRPTSMSGANGEES